MASSPYPSGATGIGIAGRDDPGSDEPGRLYALCEMVHLSEEGGGRGNFSVKEIARRKEALEQLWEGIRAWLDAHPSSEEREVAAQHQGMFLTTALHMVCKLPDPPQDVVESLISCSPETVTWADSNGWLPLHHACANGASGTVLSILVNAYPQSKVAQDRRSRTPLHFAFFRSDVRAEEREQDTHHSGAKTDGYIGNSMPEIVGLLSDSGAAQLHDENGMLPLHYACAYGTSTAVLEVLVDAYPESIVARENKGRTHVHLAMVNAHRSASPGVLKFLLSIRGGDVICNMTDREGQLPVQLLANITSRLGPDQKDGRTNASACLEIYLNAKPRATVDFLTALQALPEWLRDTAVVNPHVQHILNTKIVKRFPTSILMLDGYMLILLIVCFEITSSEHIDYRFSGVQPSSDGTLLGNYVGGAYFLLRELVQIISLWSLGTFKSWFFDSTNWLDMLLIVLVFYFTSAMLDGDQGSDDTFRTGVAFTKGILWCAVISFLKSTLVDFAVFVGGVFYVVRRLAAFLLALGVILLAFAQMFLIVYTETGICSVNNSANDPNDPDTCDQEFPHCNFADSLLKVYTMLMGEIGDETRYETSTVAQFLYVAFAFLVVILLSNVLIAIVTDSYEVIQNDRSAIVFWSNRLDFVAEMDAISSVKTKIRKRKGGDSGVLGAPTHIQETPFGEGRPTYSGSTHGGSQLGGGDDENVSGDSSSSMSVFRDAWKNLMSLFDSSLYDDIDVILWSFEFWCYFFFRIVAITIIIPLWLVAGFATAGWLWPPQVREWLFVQKKTAISRADLANQVLMQIKKLKDEMKSLRVEIKDEMKSDRAEMVNMKTEVEGVQADVMSDLLQVKEIMTTLLEMSRGEARRREERASMATIAAVQQGQGSSGGNYPGDGGGGYSGAGY